MPEMQLPPVHDGHAEPEAHLRTMSGKQLNGVGAGVGTFVGAGDGGVGTGVGARVGGSVGEHLPPKRLHVASKQHPPAALHLVSSAFGSEQAFAGAAVVVVVGAAVVSCCLRRASLCLRASFPSSTTLWCPRSHLSMASPFFKKCCCFFVVHRLFTCRSSMSTWFTDCAAFTNCKPRHLDAWVLASRSNFKSLAKIGKAPLQ